MNILISIFYNFFKTPKNIQYNDDKNGRGLGWGISCEVYLPEDLALCAVPRHLTWRREHTGSVAGQFVGQSTGHSGDTPQKTETQIV